VVEDEMFERVKASGLRLRDFFAGGAEPSEGSAFEESRGSARGKRAGASAFPFPRLPSPGRIAFAVDKLKHALLETGAVLQYLSEERSLHYVYWALHYYGFGWVVRKSPDNDIGMLLWRLYRESAPKIVQCKSCEKRVRSVISIFGHTTQGIDCACSIVMEECEPCGTGSPRSASAGKHYYLEGGYGSSHYDDFEIRWAFVGAPPEKLLRNGGNPICDECVKKMIDDGQLVSVRPRPSHFS
jgi:hypothetical protein